jgi:hypothetical protein
LPDSLADRTVPVLSGISMSPKPPFVQAALICDQVLQEKDGTLSAMRIVDTFTLEVPEDVPGETLVSIEFTILISMKRGSDDTPGSGELRLALRNPKGKDAEIGRFPAVFSANEPQGFNLISKTRLGIKLGTHDVGLRCRRFLGCRSDDQHPIQAS